MTRNNSQPSFSTSKISESPKKDNKPSISWAEKGKLSMIYPFYYGTVLAPSQFCCRKSSKSTVNSPHLPTLSSPVPTESALLLVSFSAWPSIHKLVLSSSKPTSLSSYTPSSTPPPKAKFSKTWGLHLWESSAPSSKKATHTPLHS